MIANILGFGKINPEYFSVDESTLLNNESLIYGEVFHEDILKIIKNLNYNIESILDIGSGCGKIVTYLALNTNYNIDGIEIEQKRYQKSLSLLEDFDLYDKVNFINNSFINLYFGKYDLLYCCNTIFTYEDNLILYKKILNEFEGIFISILPMCI